MRKRLKRWVDSLLELIEGPKCPHGRLINPRFMDCMPCWEEIAQAANANAARDRQALVEETKEAVLSALREDWHRQ